MPRVAAGYGREAVFQPHPTLQVAFRDQRSKRVGQTMPREVIPRLAPFEPFVAVPEVVDLVAASPRYGLWRPSFPSFETWSRLRPKIVRLEIG